MPRLVEAIADRLSVSERPFRPEVVDNLRLYADLRREQGYDVSEILAELGIQRQVRAHPAVADGAGLGLGISRAVVGRRGGRIWFESEQGEGSTFHVILPRSAQGNGGGAGGRRGGGGSPRKDQKRRR